jgi:hypothetical protein
MQVTLAELLLVTAALVAAAGAQAPVVSELTILA